MAGHPRNAKGNKVEKDYFNTLSAETNELFADTHANEGPSETDDTAVQDSIRWGWGGTAISTVARGDKVTSTHANELVNRINISTLRTDATDNELVVTSRGGKITADFFNTAHNYLELARAKRNEVDPNLTQLTTLNTFSSTTGWTNKFETQLDYLFGTDPAYYESARHFFNAGGDIRLELAYTNGSGSGYTTWKTVFADMGILKLSVDTIASLNSVGITQDVGFSELNSTEKLLYTSPAGGGGSYGGYGGYGGYAGYGNYSSIRVKVYGRVYGTDSKYLNLRIVLDSSSTTLASTGELSVIATMVHPNSVTENNVTLDIPTPVVSNPVVWTQT